MNEIQKLYSMVFQSENLIKMIFSGKRLKSLPYNKVTVRPVIIQNEVLFQIEYTYDKKVNQTNVTFPDAIVLANKFIFEEFKQVNIFNEDNDIQILASNPENPKIITKAPTMKKQNLEHNRIKKYIIPDNQHCDFLIRLGVMDANGKVIQKHYNKFRQINRYLEIVEDVFPYLPTDRTIKIIDFGCGKAYLTFAIYHYLKIIKNRDIEIIGLDLKEDVINFCNKVALDLKYDNLHFVLGDIANYTNSNVDMVVTLHACDTATDYALINAVAWNTKIILSVPCCQHELFSQISNEIHAPILKHGILKDRLTEYLTDGLRSLKLESKGYEVSLIEFTSLEHTSKNIMIKAVKFGLPNSYKSKKALQEYENLCDFYHVTPTIDKL